MKGMQHVHVMFQPFRSLAVYVYIVLRVEKWPHDIMNQNELCNLISVH